MPYIIRDNQGKVCGVTNMPQDEVKEWKEDNDQELLDFLNPILPVSVTAWQFRKALNALGLRDIVEQAVAASSDKDLKDGWEYAKDFVSNDPLVLAMGQAIGKTEDEIYQVFQLAESK